MPKAKKVTAPQTPRGKTPSLIGSSLGNPKTVTAGASWPCSRCKGTIPMDETCYDIPQPTKPFSQTRRFCTKCYQAVLNQTRLDLEELQSAVATAGE
jgi:hypothetical protein